MIHFVWGARVCVYKKRERRIKSWGSRRIADARKWKIVGLKRREWKVALRRKTCPARSDSAWNRDREREKEKKSHHRRQRKSRLNKHFVFIIYIFLFVCAAAGRESEREEKNEHECIWRIIFIISTWVVLFFLIKMINVFQRH